MNITLRTKIFIVGGLIIGFLLAVSLSLYFSKDKNKKDGSLFVSKPTVENTETKPIEEFPYKNNNNVGPQNKVIEATAPITNYTSDEIYVKQLATLFVERFNTYSNRAGNVNIDDALALSTKEMASWLNSQRIRQEENYKGVTTKVLASDIKTLSKDKARVSVGMEEITYQNGLQTSKFRTGLVDLTKVDGEWKVSGFFWEE